MRVDSRWLAPAGDYCLCSWLAYASTGVLHCASLFRSVRCSQGAYIAYIVSILLTAWGLACRGCTGRRGDGCHTRLWHGSGRGSGGGADGDCTCSARCEVAPPASPPCRPLTLLSALEQPGQRAFLVLFPSSDWDSWTTLLNGVQTSRKRGLCEQPSSLVRSTEPGGVRRNVHRILSQRYELSGTTSISGVVGYRDQYTAVIVCCSGSHVGVEVCASRVL